MHNRALIAGGVILACLVSGCAPAIRPTAVHILFPAEGARYDEGSPVSFNADRPVVWTSSIDGTWESGQSLRVFPSPGNHIVRALASDGADCSISIQVAPATWNPGAWRFIVPGTLPSSLVLAAGTYHGVGINADTKGISLNFLSPAARTMASSMPSTQAGEMPLRDIQLALPKKHGLTSRDTEGIARSGLEISPRQVPAVPGDLRTFRMADPSKGSGEPGWTIAARCLAVYDDVALWLDEESEPDPEALAKTLDAIGNVVLPRCRTLLGNRVEPDADGCLSVLLSKRLNEGRLAIGFFNPCDFFPFDDDPRSESYNPCSNLDDILYAGIPISSETDFAYCPEAIAATVAHEYQHLARFGRKTYSRIAAGIANAVEEDTSFDEGASHVMESVAGYGLSGGNLRFLKSYLDKPERYSLLYADADGALDSAGKRGLAALFLAWLMKRDGSLEYDESSPGVIGNPAAFSIIRLSMDSAVIGWEYLENRFSVPLASLWKDFCLSLLECKVRGRISSWSPDPITGEPNSLDSMMGDISDVSGTILRFSGPNCGAMANEAVIPAFGATFFATETVSAKSVFSITASKAQTSLFGLFMY